MDDPNDIVKELNVMAAAIQVHREHTQTTDWLGMEDLLVEAADDIEEYRAALEEYRAEIDELRAALAAVRKIKAE